MGKGPCGFHYRCSFFQSWLKAQAEMMVRAKHKDETSWLSSEASKM